MGLVEHIKDDDWRSVRSAIAKLATKLGPESEPTFAGLTLTGLTATRLIASDADKALVSTDIASWVLQGSANQVIVNDEGDGTATLSTPQNIHTGATPTFAGLTLVNAITEFSKDGTMGGNSDSAVPTEKAVVTYSAALGATYQPLDNVLTDLSALAVVADNEFIVGTGAGVYAHESGATARTSMGLGTGDSPTFTGLNLSGLTASKIVETDGSKNLVSGVSAISDLVPYTGADTTVDLGSEDLTTTGDITGGVGTFDEGILSEGASLGYALPTGAGTRLMWIPDKWAFRAGKVDGVQWDSIGDGSFACGQNCIASGLYSFAGGRSATASGTADAFAFGLGAAASGSGCIAMGQSAVANQASAVAIGHGSTASAASALALGDATASAQGAIGIGTSCDASGANAVALGQLMGVSGDNAVGIGLGDGADVAGDRAVGLGYHPSITAAGTYGVAAGENATVSATRGLALGSTSEASAAYALAIGWATASGASAVALGGITGKVIASAAGAIAIGDNFTNNNANTLQMGYNAAILYLDSGRIRLGNISGSNYFVVTNTGDALFGGTSTGWPFGSFWGNEIAFVAAGGTGSYFEITDGDITTGQLHNVTHNTSGENTLDIGTYAGMYLVNWSISVKATGANKHIVGAIGVDAGGGAGSLTAQNDGRNHAVSSGNAEFGLSGTAILDLSANSEVGLMATNETDNTNVTVEHVGLSILQIGGT